MRIQQISDTVTKGELIGEFYTVSSKYINKRITTSYIRLAK